MTLIERLSAGERWDGDNAEVKSAMGIGPLDERWHLGWAPLDSVDDALAIVPEGMTVNLRIHPDGTATCALSDANSYEDGNDVLPTACVALCIAILRTGESHD